MPLSPQQAAIRRFPRDALSAILDTDTGELLEYQHLIKNPKYRTIWKNAYGKELGHLAQGIPSTVQGTNTIVFIAPNQIPPTCQKDVTYGRICANFRPEKEDPYRIHLTVGANRITYPGNCGTPTADMLTTKVLLNSVISTKGARFMTIDIRDFYLNTPMVHPEYMRLKLSDIPDHIIALFNSTNSQPLTDTSMSLSKKVCTVSHKQESSPSNYLKSDSPPMATDRAPSHQVARRTLHEDGLDACGAGYLTLDGLDGGTKLVAAVFAGSKLDVGQWDDCQFSVVNGDALGGDAGNSGP
eukprot:CCRYP_015699-RA/>CCRYP_015699-RA protein AED:0.48 eAED:0.59 QI:0/0/0/0.33/0/0.66/3/0/297